MEPHQHLSSLSSLQQLLKELEDLITFESSKNNNPWISVARLNEVFCERYGASIKDVMQAQGYSNTLRSLLRDSRRFSIYATPIPQEFYVALRMGIISSYNQNRTKTIRYRVKRS